MTAPVFLLVELGSVGVGDVVELSGAEGRHAVSVLRMIPNEPVSLVDGHGRRATGVIDHVVGRDLAAVRIDAVMDEDPPQPRIIVIQALPKGDRGELAVELLTEIGADVIVPWSARNCVAQWRGDRAERGHRRWADAALAAAKQSRRSRFPVVEQMISTAQAIERVRASQLSVVLHETAEHPIGDIELPASGDVVIVVGPEGGVAAEEIDALVQAGAVPVVLGPSVLRTSSAGMAAVAALLARSGRWNARMGP